MPSQSALFGNAIILETKTTCFTSEKVFWLNYNKILIKIL
jgi:hypothetical protein